LRACWRYFGSHLAAAFITYSAVYVLTRRRFALTRPSAVRQMS